MVELCCGLQQCMFQQRLMIHHIVYPIFRVRFITPDDFPETWTLTELVQNKLAAAQTKMERSMLNITYKDRRTNIWVREKTKLIDIIYTVRKMKWSLAGHINRLKDDRWTSRVTAWRPYDKKRRQGRPAKRWRDDLDKYWSDTIWQRTGQDMVIWIRHAEAFAQPRDTTAA